MKKILAFSALMLALIFLIRYSVASTPMLELTDLKHSRPNIILISVDTLRGDYFTAERMPLTYGWAKNNSMIFTNAHANSTWTKPSHVTMMTGKIPSEHRVESGFKQIPTDLLLVQERLQEAGYKTAAFTGGGLFKKEFGFGRGFDEYREIGWAKDKSEMSEILDTPVAKGWTDHGKQLVEAKEYLRNYREEEPFFLFVHTYMVHQFWINYFPDDVPAGEGIDKTKIKRFSDINSRRNGEFAEKATASDRRNLYKQTVSECDVVLHDFLNYLKESPFSSDTILIITSDHGEGLGDKYDDGYISLAHCLPPYKDQTHVPLVVYGLGAGMTDQLVGLDDIAGTILQITGIEKHPAKSLGIRRESVTAEYISWNRQDSIRYQALISSEGRQMSSYEDMISAEVEDRPSTRAGSGSGTSKEISKEIKGQLEALGYLN